MVVHDQRTVGILDRNDVTVCQEVHALDVIVFEDTCDVTVGICKDGISKRTLQMLNHRKTTGIAQVGVHKRFIERDYFEKGSTRRSLQGGNCNEHDQQNDENRDASLGKAPTLISQWLFEDGTVRSRRITFHAITSCS